MDAMHIDKMERLTLLLVELLFYAVAAGLIVIFCLRALRSSCHQKSFNWKIVLCVWLCLAGLNAVLMNIGHPPKPWSWLLVICFLLDLPGAWFCFVLFLSWHAIAIGGFIDGDELADYGGFLVMAAALVSSFFWATVAGYFCRHKMAPPIPADPPPVPDQSAIAP